MNVTVVSPTDVGFNFFKFVAGFATFILTPGCLIILYGFREKHRTRFNECLHLRSCPAALVHLIVKLAIQFLAVFATLISLAIFIFAEALWLLLFVSKELCDQGSQSVEYVFDILTDNDIVDDSLDDDVALQERIDEICDGIDKSRNSGLDALIGALVLLFGCTICLCYWYKYSTLTLATPFIEDQWLAEKRIKTRLRGLEERSRSEGH